MEIGKLEISRLRNENTRFVVILETNNTKTGRAREVPLPEILTPLIHEQLKLNSPYLFPMQTDLKRHVNPQGIDVCWVKAKNAAGIKGRMRMHDTRHSCASNLAKGNVNTVVAVTNLGMSLAMFQKTYLKLTSNDLIVASEEAVHRLKQLLD